MLPSPVALAFAALGQVALQSSCATPRAPAARPTQPVVAPGPAPPSVDLVTAIGRGTDPRRCAHAQADAAYPEGNATLRFVLTESGQVEAPVIVQSAGLSQSLQACLVQEAGRWKLPAQRGGRVVHYLRFDFSLRGLQGQPGEWAFIKLTEPPAPPRLEWTRQPSSIFCQNTKGPPAPEPRPAGNLEKEVIKKIVQGHLPAVKDCYEEHMNAPPYPRGRLMARFSIGFDGRVQSSCAIETTVTDPAIDLCILNDILSWQFPLPQNGDWVVVEYPFVLLPKE